MKSRSAELHSFGVKMTRGVESKVGSAHLAEGPLADLRANLIMHLHESWEGRR